MNNPNHSRVIRLLMTLICASLMACDEDTEQALGPCPGPADTSVQCVWEGPVSYDLVATGVDDEAVYLIADLRWSPCGARPGVQQRSVRVDLATASSERVSIPDEVLMNSVETDSESVSHTVAERSLELLVQASDSVEATQLVIGTLREGDASVPLLIDVVCSQEL